MERADIGLVGLAIMGQNLALNMENKGFRVALYNRSKHKIDDFVKGRGSGKNFISCYSIKELCDSVKKPRKIILMIKAGEPVDKTIEQVLPHLDLEDIIIDGGNSFFKDTIRRQEMLNEKKIHFIGMGISGGEEGALKGPSIMSGGSENAWNEVRDIFLAIAAKVDEEPCCLYNGPNGAGHYLKMVHNGIEYGDMQLIAESYNLLKNLLKLGAKQLFEVYSEWNQGELDSYLIEITKNIFQVVDTITGQPLIDLILDTAGHKGTGKWTSQEALEIGIPTPTIAEAVFARFISALKDERLQASKILEGPEIKYEGNKEMFIESIRKALLASKICTYAQGFALLKEAGKVHGWNFNPVDIALTWRGGCIIRARFLGKVKEAFDKNPELDNLLLDPYFKRIINDCQEAWRSVIKVAIDKGLPVSGFTSALAYYDSYRSSYLPVNLIQAQRDYFGAHGYERVDKSRGEFFHYDEWSE
ncbi:MAG: decarboxylating NADP(+)-dependent phosphogluconate dehydrogenase [Candidatus Hodarchaeales archaeon]|jgi:6-phosphogluconate dehydrogenase